MAATFLGTAPDGGFVGVKNYDSTRSFTFKVRVRCDVAPSVGNYADILACLRTAGIFLGATSPIDGGVWVKSISPQCDKARNLASAGVARRWDWTVTVTCASTALDKPSDANSPADRPPIITFGTAKREVPVTAAMNTDGKFTAGVTNTAGDPITRGKHAAALVVKISKTFGMLYSRNKFKWFPIPEGTDADPSAYDGSITGIIVTQGVSPGFARLDDLTITPTWENGQIYQKVDAEFIIDPDSFLDIFDDQGFRYLKPDGTKMTFMDRAGQTTHTPQFLDGNGHPLPAGAKPFALKYQYYPLRDWSNLTLP
jgi:hypothetical protein